jgi:sugar phosphate isomerase/epimerase
MPALFYAALTALEWSPPLEVGARCGFDQIGLRLLPATPEGIAYPLMNDRNQLKETVIRLRARGITVADLEVVAFRPETQVGTLLPFLDSGATRGAKHTLVACYDPEPQRLLDRFAEYCEVAHRFGLTADLEFMPWACVPDLNTVARIVDAVAHPVAGILVDALHFDRSGSRVEDLRKIPVIRLHYWQLCDGSTEHPITTEKLIHAAREERLFPGEGGIDLLALTRSMPRELTISIEVPTLRLKTLNAELRARRALAAAKAVIAVANSSVDQPVALGEF